MPLKSLDAGDLKYQLAHAHCEDVGFHGPSSTELRSKRSMIGKRAAHTPSVVSKPSSGIRKGGYGFPEVLPIQYVIEHVPLVHAVEHQCAFREPCCDPRMLRCGQHHCGSENHGANNRFDFVFQPTHPSVVALLTHIPNLQGRIRSRPFFG